MVEDLSVFDGLFLTVSRIKHSFIGGGHLTAVFFFFFFNGGMVCLSEAFALRRFLTSVSGLCGGFYLAVNS